MNVWRGNGMKIKKNYIKESTSAYYVFELQNYILPALGDLEIDDLNEDMIQKNVYAWQTGNNIAHKTIKKINYL